MNVFEEPCDEAPASFSVEYKFKDDGFWDSDTIVVWSMPGATTHVKKYVTKKLKSKYGKYFLITYILER